MPAILSLFSDYTFRTVAAGSVLLGIISGILGCYAVLRKQSLIGDGVSHAALPGVVLAFLLTGSKNTEVLLAGALVFGLLAVGLITLIVRYSRIKFDSALALVMSVFFGGGLVLLTYIQKIPDASQAGLKRFIYGQASTLLAGDVTLIAVCSAVLLLVVLVFWKEFKLLTFDPAFTGVIGLPAGKIDLLLSLLIVLAIIIGLQTVGVVLMSAMLITPAVGARQWTSRFWLMAVLSAVFGGTAGLVGTAASSLVSGLPTGPAIVLTASSITCLSLLFAPGRGILYRLYRHRQNKIRMSAERRRSDVSAI